MAAGRQAQRLRQTVRCAFQYLDYARRANVGYQGRTNLKTQEQQVGREIVAEERLNKLSVTFARNRLAADQIRTWMLPCLRTLFVIDLCAAAFSAHRETIPFALHCLPF